MLYRGDTVYEAVSKALGRRRFKQDDVNPHGTPEAIANARRKAVKSAMLMIASADVSVGARETGLALVYDKTTGETRPLREPEVGQGSENHFHFNFSYRRNREVVLVTAHSHPKVSEAGGWREQRRARELNAQNEGIVGNDDDEQLLERAPVVIKTPTGRVLQFWKTGGYE